MLNEAQPGVPLLLFPAKWEHEVLRQRLNRVGVHTGHPGVTPSTNEKAATHHPCSVGDCSNSTKGAFFSWRWQEVDFLCDPLSPSAPSQLTRSPNYRRETRSQCSHPPSSHCVLWLGNAAAAIGWLSKSHIPCVPLAEGRMFFTKARKTTTACCYLCSRTFITSHHNCMSFTLTNPTVLCPEFSQCSIWQTPFPTVFSQPERTGPISIKRGGATVWVVNNIFSHLHCLQTFWTKPEFMGETGSETVISDKQRVLLLSVKRYLRKLVVATIFGNSLSDPTCCQ